MPLSGADKKIAVRKVTIEHPSFQQHLVSHELLPNPYDTAGCRRYHSDSGPDIPDAFCGSVEMAIFLSEEGYAALLSSVLHIAKFKFRRTSFTSLHVLPSLDRETELQLQYTGPDPASAIRSRTKPSKSHPDGRMSMFMNN